MLYLVPSGQSSASQVNSIKHLSKKFHCIPIGSIVNFWGKIQQMAELEQKLQYLVGPWQVHTRASTILLPQPHLLTTIEIRTTQISPWKAWQVFLHCSENDAVISVSEHVVCSNQIKPKCQHCTH